MKVICSIQDGFNYPDDLGFVKDGNILKCGQGGQGCNALTGKAVIRL
ncbi:MAG TPA: hypothetical protein VHC48_02260 [Puia sp.]|nr:hypothetical protein [Puia sp.]